MNFVPPDWPIIDMHTHLWSDASGLKPAADSDVLIEMENRFNLEGVVLIPLFGGLCPSPKEVAAGNEAALAFAQRDKRFRPMVTVYPRHGEFALEQINRWMKHKEFCALKIWVSFADEPCVFPLIERMIELDKPTLIHAMHKSVGQLPLESDPTHIARLAKHYPQAKIILPHIGGNFYYTCDVIADYPNIYTDPSGTYCETGMLEHAVKTLGPDRILFGSDAPGADFVNNLAKVMCADISESDQRNILAANAKKLWGWA
jgi:predicted TIM-barrel fold metal-dependent hydrolase